MERNHLGYRARFMNTCRSRFESFTQMAQLPGVRTRAARRCRHGSPSTAGAVLEPGVPQLVPTGLSIEVPPGYEAQIRPRSGLALKHAITLPNAPATIDPGYRGEIKVILLNLGKRSI